MKRMNWDEKYQKGEAFWDKGAPAMKQYLARHPVRGLALVPAEDLVRDVTDWNLGEWDGWSRRRPDRLFLDADAYDQRKVSCASWGRPSCRDRAAAALRSNHCRGAADDSLRVAAIRRIGRE